MEFGGFSSCLNNFVVFFYGHFVCIYSVLYSPFYSYLQLFCFGSIHQSLQTDMFECEIYITYVTYFIGGKYVKKDIKKEKSYHSKNPKGNYHSPSVTLG